MMCSHVFRLALVRFRALRAATLACAFCFASLTWQAPARAEEPPVSLAECAACHGADGVGRDEEIPNLAGQHERYLYTQLQAFKSGKRPHKEMRYESRHLSDQEMQALARYYAQLAR
jgi:cytochrome c553